MLGALRRHHISFKNAFAGLFWAFRTQPNFRVHFVLSGIVIILGLFYRITQVQWLIIVFTIVLGISGELINTALEAMTDLITREWRQEAKIAKDVAAGMMLFISTGSVIVAGFIFIPYLLPRLGL